jgi:hypothetical protein
MFQLDGRRAVMTAVMMARAVNMAAFKALRRLKLVAIG